ncbi:hypothetical protein POTOM_015274 [Populus tomentosa]|uniref:Uncharacterized protein n=1 Tax=Populus tomentosa TaxID=118781 RepID=A0A8X8CWZ5_POPTO|nr:hypothetical protein POTOM_015274 [Populus tomentosa]
MILSIIWIRIKIQDGYMHNLDRCEAKENAREEEFKAPPCSKICCLLSNQVFDHFYPRKAGGHGLIAPETLAEQLRFKASNVKIQGHLDKLGREKTVKPKLERKRAPNKRSLDELWFHLLQNNNGFGMHNQSCSNKEWCSYKVLKFHRHFVRVSKSANELICCQTKHNMLSKHTEQHTYMTGSIQKLHDVKI